MIVGIVAAVTILIPYLYLVTSLGGGIVAIVLGSQARHGLAGVASVQGSRSQATAGWILGIVSVCGSVISGFFGLLLSS